MRSGDRASRTLNSCVAERTTVDGSLAESRTWPAALKSHCTLERTQLVIESKIPLSVAFVTVRAAKQRGLNVQSQLLISGR